MTTLARSAIIKSITAAENKLFFKQWLRSPAQLGTFAPISWKLANLAAKQLHINENTKIVEIGAGTGRLTRALLARGVNIENLTMVELDQQMSVFLENSLQQMYPNAELKVITGDACNLGEIIPDSWCGKVDYVVSAIPLLNLNESVREKIISAALDVLNPLTGSIVHVSYSPVSPIRFMEGDVLQKRAASLWNNVPPGFVWCFTQKRYLHDLSA
jgi:phosphatidylethanolamine/phosphatidyl-N-methylethanolamine N-methyltransferase